MLYLFLSGEYRGVFVQPDEVIAYERPKKAHRNSKKKAGGQSLLGSSLETLNNVSSVNFVIMILLWLDGTNLNPLPEMDGLIPIFHKVINSYSWISPITG